MLKYVSGTFFIYVGQWPDYLLSPCITHSINILTVVLQGCVASRPVIGWRLPHSNSTQITDGCGAGHIRQLLCFRCVHAITADTVIADITTVILIVILIIIGIPSPTHSLLKSFLFCKSSLPSLSFFSFRFHYMDFPDCLLYFWAYPSFYFSVYLFLHFLVVGSVR